MYSFTVKPFFVPQFISSSSSSSTSTSSSSISLASFSSRSLSSISFSRNSKHRGRFGLKVEAYDSSNNDASKPSSAGDSKPPNGTLSKSRREILLEYVKNVQPEFMELFVKRAPQQVVDAMRQTVTNMIGTLPPQFFAVTITTVAENLAQLMYSVIMTGYMFRNAQYRLELQESLEQVAALPDVQDKKVLTSRRRACYWVKENIIVSSSCFSLPLYIQYGFKSITSWFFGHGGFFFIPLPHSVSASVVPSLSPVTLLIPLQRNSIKIIFCFGENEFNL
ncbi:uncharacterized protein LOC108341311 isoform X2 [Vigna angularis]|uniref:uncharacterized protein LOC108341311 isoform X2 n=1 Tax=Phaseolus angularis TaxID=3914 RepID=UPI0022B3C22E|nr:uncharacterized protein LOC108341311 isoform X2 [Vigna angularis]